MNYNIYRYKGKGEMGKMKIHKHKIMVTRVKVISALLMIAFLLSAIGFYYTNKKLNNSIQNERAAAVEQIGYQIVDKISLTRDFYTQKTEQLTRAVNHAGTTTFNHLEGLLDSNDMILFISNQGEFYDLQGKKYNVNDTELLYNVLHSKEVLSSFSTIQTKGDYWLFASRLDHSQVSGKKIIAVVLCVESETYANIATISLYNKQGASFVLNNSGAILMRPSSSKTDSVFSGYNLLTTLENAQVDETKIKKLKKAFLEGTSYQMIATIKGNQWLIENFPGTSERNIIVVVPISMTAQGTYAGMRLMMVDIVIMVFLLALIVLINVLDIQRRSQRIFVEQAKTKAKNDFIDKMSHDIRTPLNSIIGMHELALESIDDPEVVRDCLSKAMSSSEYLVSIINDVLDMSRIDSGKMVIAHEPFSMKELLNQIMIMETQQAKVKGLKLILDIQTPIDTDFLGDSIRIRQCLMNLVSNSIKFTPDGGEVMIIYQAEIHDTQADITLTIKDTGIGMSEEFQKRLFVPFEQERNSMITPQVGSGLGLSIVYNLVTLMGGHVSVKSQINRGSCFSITFPLTTTKMAPVAHQYADEESIKAHLQGKCVLVAEDHDMNREIIAHLLEKLNIKVVGAVNGNDAVEKFLQSTPGTYDLILMDIQMPVMNGLEATRAIRNSQHKDGQSIPIIALSANAYIEDMQKSVDAGMQSHLAKPVNIEELKKTLMHYIP